MEDNRSQSEKEELGLTVDTPEELGINSPKRDEKGRLIPGQHSLNPNGRPKGKTIKDRVREWLEEHPDDMNAFIDHFVKKNRDLAWQMMEGRPSQGIGQAQDLEKLQFNITQYGDDKPAIQSEEVSSPASESI